jgi:hypothetical protein
MRPAGHLLAGALLTLAASGCWGSRSYVSAADVKYPVSLSSAVRGPDGRVLRGDDIEKVATFRMEYTACRMLWTLIPIKSGHRDISDEVNEQVARKGGEAVVNLSVESSTTIWGVMTIVGVLPDCGKVRIKGDIVARAAPPPAPAGPPAPPAPPPPPELAPPAAPSPPLTTAAPTSENTP